ncbi:MAG: restriction endonuclease [Candidatus Cloacimonetes bacterium]|nr:restriction endonuclease [Candidatus Cloacimonadota bacterium]HOA29244.1 ATP-binding protein [Candidatus Cloacimonadota bacterium]HOH59480.1 ATP-binding protein [Candidatus Cloacimonadota bacterium]
MIETKTAPVVLIKKASGQTEAFDITKLQTSLLNAGADEAAISHIAADITNWVYPGASTAKIYSRAFKILKRLKSSGASLYKLKKAISEIGPSGYPFEHFIGEIYKRRGFDVEVGIVIEGASVGHEMDVVASQGKIQILGECKYSVNQGFSVGIQVPLYVHSRVNDIIEKWEQEPQHKGKNYQTWIFTNGRFSADSIRYSKHTGIHLMGWDYPYDASLKLIIQREKLYPITILTNLTNDDKKHILSRGIVTCVQLQENPGILDRMDIPSRRKRYLYEELDSLMNMPGNPG